MKKLLFILFFILICNIIFSETNNNKNLPLKPPPMLDKINKECLATLYLTSDQRIKIEKLQNEFYKIEIINMNEMNKAFNEYKIAYSKDPNSNLTKEKKKALKKIRNEIKKDYREYENKLFKILNEEQIRKYNMFYAKQREHMKHHMKKHLRPPPPPPNNKKRK